MIRRQEDLSRPRGGLGIGAHYDPDAFGRFSEGVARLYLDLFVRMVWEPFVAAGQPPEQWADVQAALDEVSTLATEPLSGA